MEQLFFNRPTTHEMISSKPHGVLKYRKAGPPPLTLSSYPRRCLVVKNIPSSHSKLVLIFSGRSFAHPRSHLNKELTWVCSALDASSILFSWKILRHLSVLAGNQVRQRMGNMYAETCTESKNQYRSVHQPQPHQGVTQVQQHEVACTK